MAAGSYPSHVNRECVRCGPACQNVGENPSARLCGPQAKNKGCTNIFLGDAGAIRILNAASIHGYKSPALFSFS
jgi:hypothetical protein